MAKKYVFNCPLNWPAPPQGWTPPAGWEPDPSWGAAPHGWPLWVPVESNWVAQHKVATSVLGVAALLLVLIVIGAAAGSSDKAPSKNAAKNASATTQAKQSHHRTAAKPVHHTVQAHHKKAAPAKAVSETTTPTSSGGENSWIMPDLRGTDLQTAQDAIQSLTDDGIWFTDSHDATGQGRGQWFDRDWQVCDQNVAPGTRITADSDINFGVVRRDVESCP